MSRTAFGGSLAVALALLIFCVPTGEARSLTGTVVHRNARAHGFVLATPAGRLAAVHAARPVRPGRRARADVRLLRNGTMGAGRVRLGARRRRARLLGTVTWADKTRGLFTLSARGASILIRGVAPPVGRRAGVSALVDGRSVRALAVRDRGRDDDGIDLAGTALSLDPTTRVLRISADDAGRSGAAVAVVIPAGLAIDAVPDGRQLALQVAPGAAGFVLRRATLDGDARQADGGPITRAAPGALLGEGGSSMAGAGPSGPSGASPGTATTPPPPSEYRYTRAADPARTLVTDARGRWLATFTDGAYTVTLAGPTRTFAERTAAAAVTSPVWVRKLPAPFAGSVDAGWLHSALNDTSPDVLAVAMQYIEGAPAIRDADGLKIAGDADYGPLQADGTRQEGSDFNDYLGTTYRYGSSSDPPESAQRNSLDCSGFVRMVWGYRTGIPLSLSEAGDAIPRRAVQIAASAPGIVTIADAGRQAPATDRLAAGDVVLFDADAADGRAIDHVGIYLGRDAEGAYRFISSRKTANGPTLGDEGGRSTLDGSGYWAVAFRAARRF
jgi:cell wall-associated NlpC family hydrolase